MIGEERDWLYDWVFHEGNTWEEEFLWFRNVHLPHYLNRFRDLVSCNRKYPADAWGEHAQPIKTHAEGSGHMGGSTNFDRGDTSDAMSLTVAVSVFSAILLF